MCPVGLGTNSHYAGEDQRQFSSLSFSVGGWLSPRTGLRWWRTEKSLAPSENRTLIHLSSVLTGIPALTYVHYTGLFLKLRNFQSFVEPEGALPLT
jgi:hypothetical protein